MPPFMPTDTAFLISLPHTSDVVCSIFVMSGLTLVLSSSVTAPRYTLLRALSAELIVTMIFSFFALFSALRYLPRNAIQISFASFRLPGRRGEERVG